MKMIECTAFFLLCIRSSDVFQKREQLRRVPLRSIVDKCSALFAATVAVRGLAHI